MSVKNYSCEEMLTETKIRNYYKMFNKDQYQEETIIQFINKLTEEEKKELIENINKYNSQQSIIEELLFTTKNLRTNKDIIKKICSISRFYFKQYLKQRDVVFKNQLKEEFSNLTDRQLLEKIYIKLLKRD